MRYVFLILFCLIALPAMAQDDAQLQLPAQPQKTLWRGDAAIFEAEDLLRKGKFSACLDVVDRIIRRNVRNTDAHVYAALSWYNLGNMEKAEASIKNALGIDQAHMGAYVVAGLIALKKGDRNQAQYYLNALRVVCQGDFCVEYKTLQKGIREAPED